MARAAPTAHSLSAACYQTNNTLGKQPLLSDLLILALLLLRIWTDAISVPELNATFVMSLCFRSCAWRQLHTHTHTHKHTHTHTHLHTKRTQTHTHTHTQSVTEPRARLSANSLFHLSAERKHTPSFFFYGDTKQPRQCLLVAPPPPPPPPPLTFMTEERRGPEEGGGSLEPVYIVPRLQKCQDSRLAPPAPFLIWEVNSSQCCL
ncbi:unnamed protein product [Gadus morhua 'NCC']